MIRIMFSLMFASFAVVSAAALAGELQIDISLSQHKLRAQMDGKTLLEAVADTGTPHYPTLAGCGQPFMLDDHHINRDFTGHITSRQHSVWFHASFPIHGTEEPVKGVSKTHGSVRLSMANAKTLYDLVKSVGREHTVICVR